MNINSLLPPVCIQSVVDGQWYIVTTDSKLGWVKVEHLKTTFKHLGMSEMDLQGNGM